MEKQCVGSRSYGAEGIPLTYGTYTKGTSSSHWHSSSKNNEVIRGKRGVSPDTAWLLSEAFSTSPEFWLNLQATHDL